MTLSNITSADRRFPVAVRRVYPLFYWPAVQNMELGEKFMWLGRAGDILGYAPKYPSIVD
jgi:hypothetical protein